MVNGGLILFPGKNRGREVRPHDAVLAPCRARSPPLMASKAAAELGKCHFGVPMPVMGSLELLRMRSHRERARTIERNAIALSREGRGERLD